MMTVLFLVVGLLLGVMLGVALYGMVDTITRSPFDRWPP